MDGVEQLKSTVWPKIVAKAWADPEYRDRVKTDLPSVLKEWGVEATPDIHLSEDDLTYLPKEFVAHVHPKEFAVAAGYQSAPQNWTQGWSFCYGSPMTAQLCAQNSGQGIPTAQGWSLCAGTPLTAQLCVQGQGGATTQGWGGCVCLCVRS